jgi:RHS repeat-associated protein
MATHKLILLFLLSFLGLNVSAKQYPKINFPKPGNVLMSYTPGNTIHFSDSIPDIDLGLLNTSSRKTSYQNTVELVLRNQSDFNENAKVTISADLKYYPINVASPAVQKTITLEINYKSGALTQSDISNIFAYKNAWKVDLNITNVQVTSDAGADLALLKTKLVDFIELNVGFQEDRITRINYNTVPANLTACEDQATDELVISWSTLDDAETYELEYSFVDDYSDTLNSLVNPDNIPFNFKDNSTRISLNETYYRIPLVYERGWILYRVRAIGLGGNDLDQPVYCKWTGGIPQPMISSFPNKFHHGVAHISDKMNWQLASTFAEDGKRSDVVNYFDGTFRSRQTVTAMNLEQQLPYDQSAIFQTANEVDVISGPPILVNELDLAQKVPSNSSVFFKKAKYKVSDNEVKTNSQLASPLTKEGGRSESSKNINPTSRAGRRVGGLNLVNRKVKDNLVNLQTSVFETSNCPQPGNEKEREVIAGETIYDYQGRPAVNILPTPTNAHKLEYLPLLNISNTTLKPYAWQDFDTPNFTCPNTNELYSQPDASSGIMGAAAYYSHNNPNRLGFNAFIPEALGFPFTQISYLQDNTGKVAAQSGVGTTFQFGNGHETRFYYASPNQEELDRMFGTEVGDALRYQKNAVMDQNHQVSVTYLNPEGKIIATALAGKTPENLDSLDYQLATSMDVSIMNKNIINADDKTLTTEHQFIVTTDSTDYTFNYSIDPETLDFDVCDGTTVCLDCIYDIDIRLSHVESCTGIPLFTYSGTIGNLINTDGNIDLNCNNNSSTGAYPRDTIIRLGIGTYNISKRITVNQQAALAYVAEVFKDTCQSKWEEILENKLSQVDTMDCYRSCNTCDQPPVQTPTCDTTYCKPNPNRCDIIRSMMLADISPGGQYAQFVRNTDGTIDASVYPLSIFNLNNILPSFPNSINFNLLLPATFSNVSDLVNNWLPEYAEKLLPMHPEYCLLGWCSSDSIDSTLDFDVQILSTPYFVDAVNKGYITLGSPLPNSAIKPYEQLLNNDPWFLNNSNQSIKTALLNKLINYGCSDTISADELAMHMAWCAFNNPAQNQQGSTPVMDPNATPCALPTPDYFTIHGFGTEPNVADLEWTFLRSLYLSAKNEVIQTSMNAYADGNLCNSRCIGTENYNYWSQYLQLSPNYEPCNDPFWYSWIFYKDKQSRFGSGIDNILNVMANANIAIDVSSVTDFNDPCQFAQAIADQSTSINQQVANTMCGGGPSDGDCEVATAFTDLLNSMILTLQNNATCQLLNSQIPSILSNADITAVVGSHLNDSLCFAFRGCSTFYIPYLNTPMGYVAPLSVCCVSNITCPGNTNCSFDLTILYPYCVTKTLHVATKCNFLSVCNNYGTPVCSQPTPYVAAIKDYLNGIFNYTLAYQTIPSQSQLVSLTPSVFQGIGTSPLLEVSLDTASNFIITLTYNDASGKVRNCTITLQKNSGFVNWSDIKNIISITPDLSLAQNGITKDFILKVLAGTSNSNLNIITLNGNVGCWALNQCPPEVTLCDSLPVMPPYPYVNNCVNDLLETAYGNASLLYNSWEDSVKNELLKQYYAKCLSAVEIFNIKYVEKQYQYTLYYYDQAGNLVKTVPPAGVKLLNDADALQVDVSRKAGYDSLVLPSHFKTTVYRYNTLNQIIWQKTPDAGESSFYYDGLGRIVASQDAQQKQDGNFFSYTRYDLLGRMVESGKLNATLSAITNTLSTTNYNDWIDFINNLSSRMEITLTHYDDSYLPGIAQKFGDLGQQNLRMRVASTFTFETAAKLAIDDYNHATHFSYDIAGNVYKLIQDYRNSILGDKTIDYDYDLQSGKVNKVTYQQGAMDQFIHKYKYDAANRLTQVKTSPNGLIWETDAEYKYYRHGPLARMELGTDKVQGLDYMYTLQGWIKGVNGTADSTLTDMGQDGIADTSVTQTGTQSPSQTITVGGMTFNYYTIALQFGNSFSGPGYGAMHNTVARDAFGYVLDYFPNDYTAIDGNTCLDDLNQTAGIVKPLYNGNISRMYTQIQTLGNNGFNYTYDQLHRITSQNAWKIDNHSMAMLPGNAYKGTFTYDADGNIMNQFRNGVNPTPAMDNLDYFYYDANNIPYDPALGIPANATNRLAYVKDLPTLSGNYPDDIDDQSANPNNYQYDQIGNLTRDDSENINSIDWTLQKKIRSITKTTGLVIKFKYDAFGVRVMKEVSGGTSTQNAKTFYVRDAQGNTMATYSYRIPSDGSSTSEQLYWSDVPIYGSSRIGIFAPDTLITESTANSTGEEYFTASRGYKQYELSNHLGNVLATISDRKIPSASSGANTFSADILSGQDYYAFGMQMPGRSYVSSKLYRYNFNGKEEDPEAVSTAGGLQDYGLRIYNPSLGKFLSVDPLSAKYPMLTPYQFAANSPIDGVDLDGGEWKESKDADGNTTEASWEGYESYTVSQSGPRESLGTTYSTLDDLYANEGMIDRSNIVANACSGTVAETAVKGVMMQDNQPTNGVFLQSTSSWVEGATFYGVGDNFQPSSEWSNYQDNSMSYTGSMASNAKGRYATGDLNYKSNYANGKSIVDYSWIAVSGPWGNGSLENGDYQVNHLRDNRTGGYANNGVGYTFDVIPLFSTNRDLLRIHPDGGPWFGTQGCIGLQGSGDVLRQVKAQILRGIANQVNINLNVDIMGNPNNDGRTPSAGSSGTVR